MTRQRDVRSCALQVMYQLDAGLDPAAEPTRKALLDSLEESPGDASIHADAVGLGLDAWSNHDEADKAVADLAPEWPTYRQPMIDRNLLRLAIHEIRHAGTPPKVAVNEAVELAKVYGSEQTPMFINGILDRILKAHLGDQQLMVEGTED